MDAFRNSILAVFPRLLVVDQDAKCTPSKVRELPAESNHKKAAKPLSPSSSATGDQQQQCIRRALMATNPHALCDVWFAEARAAEINDSNAMALATVG